MTPVLRLLYALLAMARPTHLLLVSLVYILGHLMAVARGYPFQMEAFRDGWLALMFLSASIHYINEFADYETDRLTQRTPFSGGSGALVQTNLPRSVALHAARAAVGIGILLTLSGYFQGRLNLFSVLILGIGTGLGWLYSISPFALAWRGWGEIDNAFLGGFLLPLFGFATLTGMVDWKAALAVIPFTFLVFTNLLATTWQDRLADGVVGKQTLAVLWPRKRLRALHWTATLAAYLAILSIPETALPAAVTHASTVTLPIGLWGAFSYTQAPTPLPSVAAMIILLIAQMLGWAITL